MTNTTRRLTEDELYDKAEVINCADRACSKERKRLEEDKGFVFVPGTGPPSQPVTNLAVPTAESTLITSLVEMSSEKPLPSHLAPRETADPAANDS